tara:strand:- start:57 stop:236 length:180 start_codon:yes stop_codon:yes gene_type:complete
VVVAVVVVEQIVLELEVQVVVGMVESSLKQQLLEQPIQVVAVVEKGMGLLKQQLEVQES